MDVGKWYWDKRKSYDHLKYEEEKGREDIV